ncbi:MAG: universal stress protein [Chlamydiales bacterium]|nr:universal stress protein [Chlamydiales bacterium]
MHTYQHILVAADLVSSDDDPVLLRALEIASASNAEISLLHVVEPFYNYVSPYVVEAISEWQDQTLKSATIRLNQLGEKNNIPQERRIVKVGQVREEIVEVSNKIAADLILVGSHGRHGISLFFYGSLATDLINHATCDVLAVCVQSQIKVEVDAKKRKNKSQVRLA